MPLRRDNRDAPRIADTPPATQQQQREARTNTRHVERDGSHLTRREAAREHEALTRPR
jgi:hypothetical protein